MGLGDGDSATTILMKYFIVVNECPLRANRTCTGTNLVPRNRTRAGHDLVHHNTDICIWAFRSIESSVLWAPMSRWPWTRPTPPTRTPEKFSNIATTEQTSHVIVIIIYYFFFSFVFARASATKPAAWTRATRRAGVKSLTRRRIRNESRSQAAAAAAVARNTRASAGARHAHTTGSALMAAASALSLSLSAARRPRDARIRCVPMVIGKYLLRFFFFRFFFFS